MRADNEVSYIAVKPSEHKRIYRVSVICPYCNKQVHPRRVNGDRIKIQCGSCHKRFWLEKDNTPAKTFDQTDMMYGYEFTSAMADLQVPSYIYELALKGNRQEAYNEFCKWKHLDPTLKAWDNMGQKPKPGEIMGDDDGFSDNFEEK